MNERDWPNGQQNGKCADCDIETLELENRMMRERNERLEEESRALREQVAQLTADAAELSADLKVAIGAYRTLLLKYDKLEAVHQK